MTAVRQVKDMVLAKLRAGAGYNVTDAIDELRAAGLSSNDLLLEVTLQQLLDEVFIVSQTTTLTNITEVPVISANPSGGYMDVMSIIASNYGFFPARLDIRDRPGGSVVFTVFLPIDSQLPNSLTAPLPQRIPNRNWTGRLDVNTADIRLTMIARMRDARRII